MSREREMLRKRDKDIELAIRTLEEVSSKDREEYERAAENRCLCFLHAYFCGCLLVPVSF